MSVRKRRVPYEERTRGGFTFPDGVTRRPKRNVETPEIDIYSYSVEDGMSPAFDPNRALLRRVFFLDENKTRYVSVAFYPSMGYMPMVEFGGSKIGPIRLTEQQVMALVEHLPPLYCNDHGRPCVSACAHYFDPRIIVIVWQSADVAHA